MYHKSSFYHAAVQLFTNHNNFFPVNISRRFLQKVCTITFLLLSVSLNAYSQTDSSLSSTKALLIYDKTDEKTNIYIETYRKYAFDAGVTLTEVKLDKGNVSDISGFNFVLIYSRVMAFNMMSPVRTWLKSVKGIENKNIFILTTAANFLDKNNLDDLTGIVKKNKGIIVDATSSATGKLSDDQKVALVKKHLVKLKQQL